MVDGSHLPFEENISYTKYITKAAHAKGLLVEAELGRLSGTEDDLTVEDYDARLTNVTQVLSMRTPLSYDKRCLEYRNLFLLFVT